MRQLPGERPLQKPHDQQLANAIREFRKELGWDKGRFGKFFGSSERGVYDWEHARRRPQPDHVAQFRTYAMGHQAYRSLERLLELLEQEPTSIEDNAQDRLEVENEVAAIRNVVADHADRLFMSAIAGFLRTYLARLRGHRRAEFSALVKQALIEEALGERRLPPPNRRILGDKDRQFELYCQTEQVAGEKYRDLLRFLWRQFPSRSIGELEKSVRITPLRPSSSIGEPELNGGTLLQWVLGRTRNWAKLVSDESTTLASLAEALADQQVLNNRYGGFAEDATWASALVEIESLGGELRKKILVFFKER